MRRRTTSMTADVHVRDAFAADMREKAQRHGDHTLGHWYETYAKRAEGDGELVVRGWQVVRWLPRGGIHWDWVRLELDGTVTEVEPTRAGQSITGWRER